MAVSLTSGFHHACHANGGGFCTFNGLVIAAQLIKTRYGINELGIIDFDEHYGNGTDDIKEKLKLNYINHLTLGNLDVRASNAQEWLDGLEEELLKKFKHAELIIYQAGADCWVGDPLGGRFTKKQLAQRDEIVFSVAKKLGVGIAYNLAGGYSNPFAHVIDIHNNTMIMAQKVFNNKDYTNLLTFDEKNGA